MSTRSALERRAPLAAFLTGGVVSLAALLALAPGALSRGDLMTVVQRETAIRKEKRLLSARVAALKEGDRVVKLATDGSWHRVEFQGQEGWLPISSVSSDRNVVLSGQAVSSGVRATEQSAGARGFNPEVEARHRASRTDLAEAYRILDRIQAGKVPEDRIAQFITAGRLGEAVVAAAQAERPEEEGQAPGKDRPAPPWKR